MSQNNQDVVAGVLPPLVDYPEAQRLLGGVSRSTVKRMVDDGDLLKQKVRGRTMILRSSIDAYLKRRGAPKGKTK